MKDFITVAVFNLPSETIVIRNLLEQRGIPHFFENETIVSIDPLASLAYGGIKLKVHLKDVAAAKEILDDFNRSQHLYIV